MHNLRFPPNMHNLKFLLNLTRIRARCFDYFSRFLLQGVSTTPSGYFVRVVGQTSRGTTYACSGAVMGKLCLVWSCERRLEFIASEGQEREREICCAIRQRIGQREESYEAKRDWIRDGVTCGFPHNTITFPGMQMNACEMFLLYILYTLLKKDHQITRFGGIQKKEIKKVKWSLCFIIYHAIKMYGRWYSSTHS